MTAPLRHADLATATIHAVAPPEQLKLNRVPHAFDLPPVVHVALFGGFGLFLAILWAALGNAELALPFVIFAVTVAGGFIVPAYWAKVAAKDGPKDSFDDFLRDGIACATGHLSGKEALVQVLIMPVMLIGWALVVAAIVAAV